MDHLLAIYQANGRHKIDVSHAKVKEIVIMKFEGKFPLRLIVFACVEGIFFFWFFYDNILVKKYKFKAYNNELISRDEYLRICMESI